MEKHLNRNACFKLHQLILARLLRLAVVRLIQLLRTQTGGNLSKLRRRAAKNSSAMRLWRTEAQKHAKLFKAIILQPCLS